MDIIDYAKQYIFFHEKDITLLDYHEEALRGLVSESNYIPAVVNFRYGKKLIIEIAEAYIKEFGKVPLTYSLEFPEPLDIASIPIQPSIPDHMADAHSYLLNNEAILRGSSTVSKIAGLPTNLVFTT